MANKIELEIAARSTAQREFRAAAASVRELETAGKQAARTWAGYSSALKEGNAPLARVAAAQQQYLSYLRATNAPAQSVIAAQKELAATLDQQAAATAKAGDELGAYTIRMDAARTRHEALITAQDAERQALERLRDGYTKNAQRLGMVAAGGAAFAGSFVAAAAKMESMEVALAGVEGSAAGAQTRLAEMRDLAKSPAFTLETAVQGDVRLRQVGLTAAQSEQSMRGLAAAITVMGGTSADLDGAITALSQMQIKGKVSAEELMQLSERGVPAMQILREQFQLSAEDMNDLGAAFEERGLSSTQVIDTLSAALLQKFGPAAAQAGDTAANAMSNFKDATFRASAALGESLLAAMKPAVKELTEFLEGIEQWTPGVRTAAAATLFGGTAVAGLGAAALWTKAQLAQLAIARNTAAVASGRHTTVTRLETGAVGGLGGASRLTATAMGGLKTAAALALTPMGALTIAAGTLAAVLVGRTVKAAIESKQAVNDLSASLDSANAKTDEFIRRGALLGGAKYEGPKPGWGSFLMPGKGAAEKNLQQYLESPVAPYVTGKAPGMRPVGGAGSINTAAAMDLEKYKEALEAAPRTEMGKTALVGSFPGAFRGVPQFAPEGMAGVKEGVATSPTPMAATFHLEHEKVLRATSLRLQAEQDAVGALKANWEADREGIALKETEIAYRKANLEALQQENEALKENGATLRELETAAKKQRAASDQLAADQSNLARLYRGQGDLTKGKEIEAEAQRSKMLTAAEKEVQTAAKEARDKERQRRKTALEEAAAREREQKKPGIGTQLFGLGGRDLGDILARARRGAPGGTGASRFASEAEKAAQKTEDAVAKGFQIYGNALEQRIVRAAKRAASGGGRFVG